MASSAASILASAAPSLREGSLPRQPLQAPYQFERAPASLLQLDIPYTPEFAPDTAPGVVPLQASSDIGVPGIVPLPRSAPRMSPSVTEDEVEVQVGMVDGVGARVGAHDEELMEGGETKLIADPRELMSRQQIQPSFKADAPVSLEQVRILCVMEWMSLVDVPRPSGVPFRLRGLALLAVTAVVSGRGIHGGWVPLARKEGRCVVVS